MAETSEKIERLKREKKNAKTRLTRRKNKLNEMISEKSASKNGIRRYIKGIKSEFDIIEKLLNNLKELYVFDNIEESEVEVARLDKEIEEIGEQVDVIIEAAETHLRDRVEQGESESIDRSEDWGKSTKGPSSLQSEYEYQQQSDIDEANRRITKLQEEERRKEEELCQKRVELELAKQRTNEARKIASIIDNRSQISSPSNIVNDTDDTCSPSLLQQFLHPSNTPLDTHPIELPHRVPGPGNPPLETHPSEVPHQVPIPSIPSPHPVTNPSPLRSNQNLDLLPQQVQNPAEPNSKKTPTHFPQHPVPDSELSDNNNSFRGNPGEHLQPNSIPTTDSQHLNVDVPLHDLESNRTGYIPAQSSCFPLTYQPSPTLTSSNIQTPQAVAPIKLKGVDLPVFDGEDKTEYEQWKAAFMSAVDQTNIPVNEKMLRLQSSLKGNALKLVKDLGFTVHAYDRAKEKLEKKYGGQRRLQIKTMTVLKNWKKLQQDNLKDLE